MAAITTILPIVVLVIFIVLFFIMFRIGKRYMTIKITHWLLFIYIGVLLLATFSVVFVGGDRVNHQRVEQTTVENWKNGIKTQLINGEISKIDSRLLINEKHFQYDNKAKLTIEYQSDFFPEIFIERKQSNDDEIEAYVFSNGFVVNGIDFSELLTPYQLEIVNETLYISPIYQELNLSIVSDPFAVRQFTGMSMFDHSYNGRELTVYLRVPADLEVAGEDIYLEYINR